MKKRFMVFLAVVIVVGSTLAAWYSFQSKGNANSTNQKARVAEARDAPAVTVSSTLVGKQNVPVIVDSHGTVVSLNSVAVHPQTTSTIRQVQVKEGQFVREGELLFTLDDRADRANVEKAKAQLARDQATLADYERQFQRSTELVAQKFLSQSALDAVRTQLESQRAVVQASIAAVQSAQITNSYNLIRAPSTGRLGAITVFAGSLVQPSTALVTITQLNPIGVSFTLPERYLPSVLKAKKSGDVPVSLILPDLNSPVEGMLSFIDNAIDSQAGTIQLKANFDNANGTLWPGQYVNVRMVVDTLKSAVVLPQAAIITNTLGKQVYIVEADQKVKPVTVTVLTTFGAQAAVSGLKGGERVVVEGKQNLRPGSSVREAIPPNTTPMRKQASNGEGKSTGKITAMFAGLVQ